MSIGERVLRYDGLDHVTGRTRFVDDLAFPGMLHTAYLGSPHLNAKILNIDISKAEKVAGVAAVITHKDVPNNYYGAIPDQPALADKYVRYLGQPVVAVAAVDEDTAFEAVEQIKVDYEVLPAVTDTLKAMEPDAPLAHDNSNFSPAFAPPGTPPEEYRNYPRRIRLGDVEKAFKEADVIVEEVWTSHRQEHAQLEPHVGIAVPDTAGRLTIYTVSQCVYFHAGQIAGILQIPLHKIRMVGGTVGGAFGAKNDLATDHIVALLALKTGKPVKWRWTREMEFLISSVRNHWRMEFKDGVMKDGRVIARKVRTIQGTGAYDLWASMCMDKHAIMIRGPYHIPNVWVDGYVVYTNTIPTGAMRGYGVTQATWGFEMQMNKDAAAIGMDPVEFRLINALRKGEVNATRQVINDAGVLETIVDCARLADWPVPEKYLKEVEAA